MTLETSGCLTLEGSSKEIKIILSKEEEGEGEKKKRVLLLTPPVDLIVAIADVSVVLCVDELVSDVLLFVCWR